jgi:hypothetical protein
MVMYGSIMGESLVGGFSGVKGTQKYIELVEVNSEIITHLSYALTKSLINVSPPERVWVTVGAGNLLFSLMNVWENTTFHAVVVNSNKVYKKGNVLKKKFQVQNIIIHDVELDFQLTFHDHVPADILKRIPFKCLANYDAKLFLYEKSFLPFDLIWNVGF